VFSFLKTQALTNFINTLNNITLQYRSLLMHSFTFKSKSPLQSQYLKKSLNYQLNLNYQLICFTKYIHCIPKELNIQKQKTKKKFFFLAWARPILPERKYPSPERKIYRLGVSNPESKVYFRLSENTLAWARIPPRLGERFLA